MHMLLYSVDAALVRYLRLPGERVHAIKTYNPDTGSTIRLCMLL
jgi:hypothetical protein